MWGNADTFPHLYKPAAVDTQIILSHIEPFLIGKEFVIGSTFFVHPLDQLAGSLFFAVETLHDILDTGLKRCVDEYA